MGAAIAALAPYIPQMIVLAEQAVKASKAGASKQALVVQMGRALFQTLIGSGVIPKDVAAPSDQELAAASEQSLQLMKASGQLESTAIADGSVSLWLVRGSIKQVQL